MPRRVDRRPSPPDGGKREEGVGWGEGTGGDSWGDISDSRDSVSVVSVCWVAFGFGGFPPLIKLPGVTLAELRGGMTMGMRRGYTGHDPTSNGELYSMATPQRLTAGTLPVWLPRRKLTDSVQCDIRHEQRYDPVRRKATLLQRGRGNHRGRERLVLMKDRTCLQELKLIDPPIGLYRAIRIQTTEVECGYLLNRWPL